MPRFLGPVARINIVYSYVSGCSVLGIAAALGVSVKRVQRVLGEAGVLGAYVDPRKLCVLLAAREGLRLDEACVALRRAGLGCKSPLTLVGQSSWFRSLVDLVEEHPYPRLRLRPEGEAELRTNLLAALKAMLLRRYIETRYRGIARIVCQHTPVDRLAGACSCIRVLCESGARRSCG